MRFSFSPCSEACGAGGKQNKPIAMPKMPLRRNASAIPLACASTNLLLTGAGRRVAMQQPLRDRNADDDPADRSPNAHPAKIAIAVRQMMKRQRIGERKRRRINQRIDEREHQELPIRSERRQYPNQHAADQMADGQEFLGREIPIGKLAREKRSDDCPDAPTANMSPIWLAP